MIRTAAAGALLMVGVMTAGGLHPRVAPSADGAKARAGAATWRTHLEYAPPRPPESQPRFDGEFGLWVEVARDSLSVRWITREPSPGSLTVTAAGSDPISVRTPSSRTHHVSLPRPAARQVVLEYGALEDATDRHSTVIRLDTGERRAPHALRGVDSLFVVSDLHGELDRLVTLLRNAGLLDDSLAWSGGRAHLVVNGDVFDRGPDVIPILWLLYRLEREAADAGGGAHFVLGNHEIMVMLNDLRYVSEKEAAVAELYEVPYSRMFDSRSSVLGRWLAAQPALLRVDRVLVGHGGLSPDYLGYTLDSFADTLSTFVEHDLFRRWNDEGATVSIEQRRYDRWLDFFWGERSVFWYRDYVWTDDVGESLRRVLRRMQADVHVVGHTPVPTIEARYGGSLIAVNPAEFGTEMLLLVRRRDGYDRFRVPLAGPSIPF